MQWWLYIAECNDGSFYTGITNNTEKRIRQHNAKTGAKSVRNKLPVRIIYKEKHENRSIASKREKEIKGWSRKKKLDLIKGLP